MKARLTISLDARLLAHVDRAVGHAPGLDSRSAVIEEAVRRWSRTQYEAAIREYYSSQSQDEREQDDSWAELSASELSAVVAREAPVPPGKSSERRSRRSKR